MQLTCSICYDDISETCRINSCKHIFCRDCITKWGREKTNTCPCCRSKFNILYDANDKIIDYFVDKENNEWIDLEIYQDDFNIVFGSYFYSIKLFMFVWFFIFDEKIPIIPYNRKSNRYNRYMDMAHYQREMV